MQVVVTGTGYVGLVTGVCLAEAGHEVTCIDVDTEKINLLNQGKSPIYEKDLEELMIKNQNKLTYTTDYQTAYQKAELILIAVGTPENTDGSANLDTLYSVAKQIATSIEHDCTIVIKSTVPIGTNQKLETFIKSHLKNSVQIAIASNPEFLSQGRAVEDTLHAYRIVIGSQSIAAKNILIKLYANFNCPIICTDLASAEMIKYASNNFLALKISYTNEVANLCELVGANVEDVSYAMGLDPRIGSQFLRAGIGYGGACFPKDTKALYTFSHSQGYDFKTLCSTIEVNEYQKLRLLDKLAYYYSDFKNITISILGLTFKPETDDLREAPSLKNIALLLDKGATLQAYDPIGIPNFKKHYPDGIIYCDSISNALKNADICLIFTEWDSIKSFDTSQFPLLMKKAIILDGRNCYPLDTFKTLPVIYDSIGRPPIINIKHL